MQLSDQSVLDLLYGSCPCACTATKPSVHTVDDVFLLNAAFQDFDALSPSEKDILVNFNADIVSDFLSGYER
jgi:hypothetical protein